jgi:heptosyltransferase III
MITPENVLIVRTDRIGDVVLTLPMAKVLKEKYPSCKISFLLREYTAPLAENNRYVDDVISSNKKNGIFFLFENYKTLKNKKYDVCFIVSPSFSIALLFLLLGIKTRVGTGYRWYSFLFNKKVYVHRKYGEKNELEYNLDLLKQWGIKDTVEKSPSSFGIQPDSDALQKVKEVLRSEGINLTRPLIIAHPGSGGSAIDLPVDKFRELIALVAKELNADVILTGSKGEIELCASVVGTSDAKNFAGKFELKELIALISLCGLFIANSTGPLHIAAALGKHVIGFYPKILAASQNRWGPYTDKKNIFIPVVECQNCTRKQCEETNCMESIDVLNVFISIGKIYNLLVKIGENNV